MSRVMSYGLCHGYTGSLAAFTFSSTMIVQTSHPLSHGTRVAYRLYEHVHLCRIDVSLGDVNRLRKCSIDQQPDVEGNKDVRAPWQKRRISGSCQTASTHGKNPASALPGPAGPVSLGIDYGSIDQQTLLYGIRKYGHLGGIDASLGAVNQSWKY